jgi:hypothetical protein
MGLTSAPAAGDGTQLCVFDLRRGQHEGQELDKILFFHPADCPILLQLSVSGLCEGIVTFTRSPSTLVRLLFCCNRIESLHLFLLNNYLYLHLNIAE